MLTEKEARWYEGAYLAIITRPYPGLDPKGYYPQEWPRIEKVYQSTTKAFAQERTERAQGKETHCTPAIVPIPVAAAKPFDLLLRALEDAGGSTIDPPSAYAVQKYPAAAKFINISKIHEDLPGIDEVATTLGSAILLLAKHLTAACLFSGPNEQRGILDYLLTENNWRGMIRVLTYFYTVDHFYFYKHPKPHIMAERATIIATHHRDTDRRMARLAAPSPYEEWYDPVAEEIYRNGLGLDLEKLVARSHLAIHEIQQTHPYDIIVPPEREAESFTPFAQDETGAFCHRIRESHEIVEHFMNVESSLRIYHDNDRLRARKAAYKACNGLIIDLNLERYDEANILKDIQGLPITKKNSEKPEELARKNQPLRDHSNVA